MLSKEFGISAGAMSDEVTKDGGRTQIVPVEALPQAPPHPLDSQWHVYLDGQTYGPFSGHQLKDFVRDGRVTATTDVVRLGASEWLPASNDPALRAFFPSTLPSIPTRNYTTDGSQVSAAPGATVVQVTNNIAPPQSTRIIIEDGTAKPKSASLAFFLSLIIVGSGQLYNGQIAKGILMFVGCILLWLVSLGWIINLWSIFDAYIVARDMNDRYMRRLAAGTVL